MVGATSEERAEQDAFLAERIRQEEAETAKQKAWHEKHVPSGEDVSQAADARDKALRESGGLTSAFMMLAENIEEACNVVTSGIRNIAVVIDDEKNGPLSAWNRSCSMRAKKTITELVQAPQMPEKDRANLIEQLQELLGDLQQGGSVSAGVTSPREGAQ